MSLRSSYYELSNSDNRSSSYPMNKLTVYSQSGHIIQKYSGDNKVITLPKSVDISSIMIVDSDGMIVPFSYVPETSMGIALTDRSTGQKVDAVVTKDGQNIKGKILSLGSDNVVLLSENNISNIREYDRVVVSVNDDLTQPKLLISGNNKPFTLSYLVSNISWKCVGTGVIDDSTHIMHLRLAGNIYNETESDINAETTLVSGEVYQHKRNQRHGDNFAMQKSMMSSENIKRTALEDYVKYNVGQRLVRTNDIAEIGIWNIPVIKVYTHQTNERDIVRFGYRFTATEYIPSCSLNLYSVDNNKNIGSYLGSNVIDETQRTDIVDIILGESTLLQCTSLVVISNDIIINNEDTARKYNIPIDTFKSSKNKSSDTRSWHVITEDIKIDILNHNTSPSFLIIKHYVGDKLLVETRCKSYNKRKDGFIEWNFEVPPRTSNEPMSTGFSCQILTATYY